MEHRWVRHIVQDVRVQKEAPPQAQIESGWWLGEVPPFWIGPSQDLIAERRIAYGCDNCGLPLTEEVFAEPCLSQLEDQLEDGD